MSAVQAKQHWEMTLKEFEATKPKVTRQFYHFDSVTRANMCNAASSVGYKRKQSVGEYFYTIEGKPGASFKSPKEAKRALHIKLVESAIAEGCNVPSHVRDEYFWLRG